MTSYRTIRISTILPHLHHTYPYTHYYTNSLSTKTTQSTVTPSSSICSKNYGGLVNRINRSTRYDATLLLCSYSTSSIRHAYVENSWSSVRLRERTAPATTAPQPQVRVQERPRPAMMQPDVDTQEHTVPQAEVQQRVVSRPYILFGMLSCIWVTFGYYAYQHRDEKGASRDMYAMQHIQHAFQNTKPLQHSLPMSPNALQQQQQHQSQGHPEEQGIKSIGAYFK